jgi:hypothetical protein
VVGDLATDDVGVLALFGGHDVGVGLLEIHTDRRCVEHAIHARHLLHDRREDPAEGSAQIDDRLDHRVGNGFGGAFDLLAIPGGKHVGG